MRSKITPLAAIAFALMAAPAMAQTGHVGGAYTTNDEGDTDGFVVEGAAAFGVSNSIGMQVDGGFALLDSNGDDFTGYEINGHLFYTAGAARFGGLFGAAGGEYDGGGGNDPSTTHWGVEGQYTLNRVVLGASAIWGDAEWIISPDIEYENYDFHGDFYATENFVIGANYGVGTLDNGGGDADTSTYGVSGEWQFSTMPISLVAGYQHWEIEDAPVESETLSLGVRWNWGGTLQARDAAGFRHSPNGLIGSYVGF